MLLVGADLDNCDIEWFALETNRDHSVIFEITSKYCILDSSVDHDGYPIFSKGFLPIVVDIMVYKRVHNAVLGCNIKNDRMISVRF